MKNYKQYHCIKINEKPSQHCSRKQKQYKITQYTTLMKKSDTTF